MINLNERMGPDRQAPKRGTQANSADPDQIPDNAASDQGLHCLLTRTKQTLKITPNTP